MASNSDGESRTQTPETQEWQGPQTIEEQECFHKGPKYRGHELHYEQGKILQVHPSGFGNIVDNAGVLMIQMESGMVLLQKADDWITA